MACARAFRSMRWLGITVELETNMKKEILIAAIWPALWTLLAFSWLGTEKEPSPVKYFTGAHVLVMALIVIPPAVIGYLCGKNTKGE
jgi:hypothetical protein